MIEKNICIALNSNGEMFLFKKSKNNKLSYSIYDSNLKFLEENILSNENVICYDLHIDKKDTLHLVSLTDSGKLVYHKYLSSKWSSGIIGQFDLVSNIYKQIEILFSNDKLHIIYNFSNLINSNVWTIQHVIYDKKIQEGHIITRYISTKNPPYFTIDVDSKGTIHLIYNTNMKKTEIFHSFYNPYTNSWSSKANKISLEDTVNLFPYLFIDTRNNVHTIWLEHIDNNYNIIYLKMGSKGKRKYAWRKIQLPEISVSKYPPVIFEYKNNLNLLFIYDSSIKLIKSKDYGETWFVKEDENNINKNTILTKVKSNMSSKDSKTKYLYSEMEGNPKIYFLKIFKDAFKTNTHVELKDEKILIENQDTSSNSTIYKKLDKKLKNILDNQISIEESIVKILEYEKSIDEKLDIIYQFTKPDKKTLLEKLFNNSK